MIMDKDSGYFVILVLLFHLFVPILRKPFTGQSGLFQATADNIEQLIRNGLRRLLLYCFVKS